MGNYLTWVLLVRIALALALGTSDFDNINPLFLPSPSVQLSTEQQALLDYIDRRAAAGDVAAMAAGLERVPDLFPHHDDGPALYALRRTFLAISYVSRNEALDLPHPLRIVFSDGERLPLVHSAELPSVPFLARFFYFRDPEIVAHALKHVDEYLFGNSEPLGATVRAPQLLLPELTDEQLTDERLNAHEAVLHHLGGTVWEAPAARERLSSVMTRLLSRLPMASNYQVQIHLVDAPDICSPRVTRFGDIYVPRLLIERAETDDILAFILAHELAHLVNGDFDTSVARAFWPTLRAFLETFMFGRPRDAEHTTFVDVEFDLQVEIEADKLAVQVIDEARYSLLAVPVALRICNPASSEYNARLQAFHGYLAETAAGEENVAAKDGFAGLSSSDKRELLTAAQRMAHWLWFGDDSHGLDFIHDSARGLVDWAPRAVMAHPWWNLLNPQRVLYSTINGTDGDTVYQTRVYVERLALPYAKVVVEMVSSSPEFPMEVAFMSRQMYLVQVPSGAWQVIGMSRSTETPTTANTPPSSVEWDAKANSMPAVLNEQGVDAQSGPETYEVYLVIKLLTELFSNDDFSLVSTLVTDELAEELLPFHESWHGAPLLSTPINQAQLDELIRMFPVFAEFLPVVPTLRLHFTMSDARVSRSVGGDLTVVQGMVGVRIEISGRMTPPIYLPASVSLVPDDAVPGRLRISGIL